METPGAKSSTQNTLLVGAEQPDLWAPLVQGKRLGLVVNQTSLAHGTHLVDVLQQAGQNVGCIFALEHGYRGTAAEGEHIASEQDAKANVPVVSLYGGHFQPTAAEMAGLDAVVFDIQDVGARFYTFASSMHYVMEACGKAGIPFILLDRPNPNGHYVDGPLLDTAYRSFVGIYPVPVVHGMTLGELARMAVGEGWCHLPPALLQVVPCHGYAHAMRFAPPVPPSPNLRTALSVWLYPSLCFFEGTPVSVGRGTANPFTCVGRPGSALGSFQFMPEQKAGSTVKTLYAGQMCTGFDFSGANIDSLYQAGQLAWGPLLAFYQARPVGDKYFKPMFDKLAGGPWLRQQMEAGRTEAEIRAGYREGLAAFKKKRAAYLLYAE